MWFLHDQVASPSKTVVTVVFHALLGLLFCEQLLLCQVTFHHADAPGSQQASHQTRRKTSFCLIIIKSWRTESSSFFFFFKLIYLFLAVLGLRFCARAFSSCGERGPLFIAMRGPLTIAASLVAEHRLQMHRLSSCGSRAQLLRGMWDLPRPGLEPVSPALAGRFSTTAPPRKPSSSSVLL